MFFDALKKAGVNLDELKSKPQEQSKIIEAQLAMDANIKQQYDSNNHSSFDRHYESRYGVDENHENENNTPFRP